LNSNNRTKSSVAKSVNGTIVYPLYVGPNIYTNTTYNNFWDCYQSVKNLTLSDSRYEKVKEVSEGMETLIRAMEDEFSCNGICTPGAFYFFRNLDAGPPTQNCLNGLKDVFKDKPLAIGILLLISFFFTIFAFITSYGLCYSKEKKH